MPEKQTHQIAITALRSAAPTSGGFGPDRCGRVPCLAMAASSVRTSSTKTSISANAAHGPGDVLAGRTAVPIVCGASVLLTTNARWLVPLPGVTFNPTPSCNHASTGWLVLAQTAPVAGFTPGERAYIRNKLDRFFSTLPTVAEGFHLKTWRGGPDAGKPKLSPIAKGLLERGLMRLDAGRSRQRR